MFFPNKKRFAGHFYTFYLKKFRSVSKNYLSGRSVAMSTERAFKVYLR